MSLNFAGISPHAPILIPGIGEKEDLIKLVNTTNSLNKLSRIVSEAEIDTLIIISPHMLIYPDRFNICGMEKLFGSFASFGFPEESIQAKNNLELAELIDQKSQENALNSVLFDNNGEFFELDHGLMVPLRYILKNQENSIKILPIAYSNMSKADHFAFGQVIREILKDYPERVGILASGDLSHQLIQQPDTKEYDLQFVNDLEKKQIQDILLYDEEMMNTWSECGYRSVLILLGALDGAQNKPEILSYEGPFGVGYLTANFKLPEV